MVAATLVETEDDPLFERARELFPTAYAWVIHARTDPRIGGAPCFKNINDDDGKWWDFFVVVGVMFVVLHTLRVVGRPRSDDLEEVAVAAFERDLPRGHQAFMDCAAFFDRTYQGVAAAASPDQRQFAATDTVALWIMWNLLDRPPEGAEERQMVRPLGIIISKPFEDWWVSA